MLRERRSGSRIWVIGLLLASWRPFASYSVEEIPKVAGKWLGNKPTISSYLLQTKQDEPANPNALRIPLSRASVNESCQRLWHKLLSMSLVNDSCQGQESATF